jgi:hypothetical protein
MKLPMKLHWSVLSLVAILFCTFPTNVQAVVSPVKSTEVVEKTLSKKELRKKARLERKKAKLKKKLDRLMKKMEKRAQKKGDKLVNLWNDGKFRLGILLLLAAVAVGIVALLISLGGLINFIAGLLALGGIVFLIWSMVDYFA